MEEIIKKIISIDKDADNYRKLSDEILVKKRKELQAKVKDMIEENLKLIDSEKKKIAEDEMRMIDSQILKIQAFEDDKLKNLSEVFSDIKDDIVESMFNKLLDSLREV